MGFDAPVGDQLGKHPLPQPHRHGAVTLDELAGTLPQVAQLLLDQRIGFDRLDVVAADRDQGGTAGAGAEDVADTPDREAQDQEHDEKAADDFDEGLLQLLEHDERRSS